MNFIETLANKLANSAIDELLTAHDLLGVESILFDLNGYNATVWDAFVGAINAHAEYYTDGIDKDGEVTVEMLVMVD